MSQRDSLPRHQIQPDRASYQDGVRCVVMPCCGFTYGEIHTTEGGIYSCPFCEEDHMQESEARQRDRYREALEAIANAEIPGVSGGPDGASAAVMQFAQKALADA